MAAFEEFGVLPEIGKAVDEMDWMLPTDVQSEAIPLILGGGDVLMAAETGSGKTGAFCLPIMQIVWETLKDFETGKGMKVVSSQPSPQWSLNVWDRGSSMAITPDGLRCQSREQKEWHGCRANKGVHSSGKYYFEATVTDEGLCRVGWSTPMASLDLGTDKYGFGFGGTGKKSNNKQFDNYGEAFGLNDVIGCYLDLDNLTVSFSKNGSQLGKAFQISPQLKTSSFFPAVVVKNAEMSFNFGAQSFKHEPSEDYIAVCQAPKERIKNSGATSASSGDGSNVVKQVANAPQAIIIEPSRELAEQTFNQIIKFKKYLESPNIRELLIIGGVSVKDQMSALSAGVDIVVATPGRLEDLINSGHLSLTHCRFFVLDEADGLLKQGYSDLIDRLHRQIPKITSDGKRLQMIVCSATLHSFEVKKMAEKLMHFPTWVDLKGEDAVPETVHHVVVMVDPQKDTSWQRLERKIQTDGVHNKDNLRPTSPTAETLSEAVKILKAEYVLRAIDTLKMDRALIFCRTKLDCDNLEKFFNFVGRGSKNPYTCVCLHGDRKPPERKANLEKFKNKQVKFLICTDVAARGIDIGGLPFMINVTLPDEKSNYVHRIGRVGRAERMGLAISMVSSVPEKVWFHGEWCSSRGRNCWNTNLTDQGGCCIWYNEPRYLGDIEEHLNITIQQVEPKMDIPADEFDGKVVYGQKRLNRGSGYETHVEQMAPTVQELSDLECKAQLMYLKRHIAKGVTV